MDGSKALSTIAPEAYDRRKYIGGSAVASILGLQPPRWRTGVQVWQRMCQDDAEEPEPPQAQRKLLARGHIVEPLVATLLEHVHGITGTTKGNRYIDPDEPYFAAEIDMEIPFGAVRHLFGDQWVAIPDDVVVNVEIKTVHPFAAKEWGEEGTEEVPIHYAAQIYWGLGVTRRTFAICAALFGADNLVLYPIVADADTIVGMRRKAVEFMACVEAREPPALQSLDDAKRLWPEADGSAVEANDDIVAACRTLAMMREKRNTFDKGADGVDLLIREHMQSATTLTLDGVELATLKQQQRKFIDEAKLKAQFPEAWKACQSVTTFRTLRFAKD